jgi:hypothetical protein
MTAWKREDNQQELQEGHRPGDHEASSSDFQQVAENQELDLVEGSPPCQAEEKPTSSVSVRRAGYVGAPATPGIMAHLGKEKKRRKLLDYDENLDRLAPYQGTGQDKQP